MEIAGRSKVLVAAVVAAGLLVSGWFAMAVTPADASEVVVYNSPYCGCCGSWIDHLRANGFRVAVKSQEDMDPVKARFGVPEALQSCHTASVAGYVVEGHVPAADIKRLLADRPVAKGLAVPGMPSSAPGMEQGGPKEPYQVVLFGNGKRSVFARY